MAPTANILEKLFSQTPLQYVWGSLSTHLGPIWGNCIGAHIGTTNTTHTHHTVGAREVSDPRWATHSLYDSIFLSIWFFYFLKWRSSALSILHFIPHQRLICSSIPITTCIQKPYKYVFSSDLLFQLLVYWTFPIKCLLSQQTAFANNLIILAIKIGHHTFPLLSSQLLLIHHAKSSWLGKLNVSIIFLTLIYKLTNH